MKRSNVSSCNRIVKILAVNSAAKDWKVLWSIFEARERDPDTLVEWSLIPRAAWRSALQVLHEGEIPVVLCGTDSDIAGAAGWKEVLQHLRDMSTPPVLILTSRLADDRLWAEALNLGAYDVLAEPFRDTEVVRSVTMAYRHWSSQYGGPSGRTRTAGAAA